MEKIVVRRFDDLGRISIPKQLRDKLGVEEGRPAEIHIRNINGKDHFVLEPIDFECKLCGNSKEEELVWYDADYKDEKCVCKTCLDRLQEARNG